MTGTPSFQKQLGQIMDRRDPIPPSVAKSMESNIVDPAAEEARRHLSWTPDVDSFNEDDEPATELLGPSEARDFVSYVGYPDGTFQVTVTIQRGETVAEQTERGTGELSGSIEDAARKAYEKADRALTVLGHDNFVEDIIEDEDEDTDELDD